MQVQYCFFVVKYAMDVLTEDTAVVPGRDINATVSHVVRLITPLIIYVRQLPLLVF